MIPPDTVAWKHEASGFLNGFKQQDYDDLDYTDQFLVELVSKALEICDALTAAQTEIEALKARLKATEAAGVFKHVCAGSTVTPNPCKYCRHNAAVHQAAQGEGNG